MPRRELPTPPSPEKFVGQPWIEPETREGGFTVDQRFEVRITQEYYCAACGASCRGIQFHEPLLSVHHVVPVSRGGTSELSNALGLCPEPCHQIFDYLALQHNTSALAVIEAMEKLPPVTQEILDLSMSEPTEQSQINLSHKRLRKGKKVKTPKEVKRHQERIRRNKQLPPILPPQADVFNLNLLGAD